MSWNFRVMRHKDGPDDFVYAIHEVYYEYEGEVANWSMEPSPVCSDEADLTSELARMAKALTLPVLDYETGEEIE